jgi:uncharacterized membrane protein
MKSLFANIRNIAVAGFLFLLPVYVLLVIITKAWASLSSVGTGLAKVFGLESLLGAGGATAVSGVLLILIWIGCGLLVRVSFVDAFNKGVERLLVKYVPGYSTYKAIAEDKLHQRTRTLPYPSVLVRGDVGWQPAFLIEQDADGHCVVFVPGAPDTSAGSVLLATRDQLRFLPAITANQLDASLKTMGKGLLDMTQERVP